MPNGHHQEEDGHEHLKRSDPENYIDDDYDEPSTSYLVDTIQSPKLHAPLYAYPLLAASVIAVSSAATVFASMAEVPPLTLAAWRLQLTTVLQTPMGLIQFIRLPRNLQHKCIQSVCYCLNLLTSMTLRTPHHTHNNTSGSYYPLRACPLPCISRFGCGDWNTRA